MTPQNHTGKQSIFSHVGWSFAQSLTSRAVGLVAFLYVATQVTLQTLGNISLVTTVVGVLQVACILPIVPAVVRSSMPLSEQTIRQTSIRIALWLLVIVALVGLALSLLVASFSAMDAGMLLLAALLLPASAWAVPREALLKRQVRIAEFSKRATLATTLSAIFALALTFAGLPEVALLVQAAIAALLLTLLMHPLGITAKSLRHSSDRFPFNDYANLASSAAIWSLSLRLDFFFIAGILGPALLGAYVLAYRMIYAVVDVCASAVGPVVLSIFARSGTKDLIRHYTLVQCSVTLLGVVGFSALTLMAGPVIVAMDIDGSRTVRQAIVYLLPFSLAATISASANAIMSGVGESRSIRKMHTIRLVVGVVSVPLGAFAGGILGCALAIFVTELSTWTYRQIHLGSVSGTRSARFTMVDVGCLAFGLAPLLSLGKIALL